MNTIHEMQQELQLLEAHSNLRRLPEMVHDGREVIVSGKRMLNLSSNDYLGLASDRTLREEFLRTLTPDTFLPTSSSSRLLTGNFSVYEELEAELSHLFGTEAALVFNSGYHANTGILPAVSDAQTLILADKLVHASLIDGIRLSAAKCPPARHAPPAAWTPATCCFPSACPTRSLIAACASASACRTRWTTRRPCATRWMRSCPPCASAARCGAHDFKM